MAKRKWKSTRGETLTEVLVAILVIAMSISLLTTAVMSAARMNRTVQIADAGVDGKGGFYGGLSQVETHVYSAGDDAISVKTTGGPSEITFTGVRSYTQADLTAYGKGG